VPSGPVRPYLYGTIGLGYFFTESSVKGTNSTDQEFASSTNFDDTTPALTLGGGFQIPVARIVAIDLGVEYRRHREARYLTEGDIVEEDDGSVTLNVNESDADLFVYRIGVSFTGPLK
jgi:opacity protein-like surface antigen